MRMRISLVVSLLCLAVAACGREASQSAPSAFGGSSAQSPIPIRGASISGEVVANASGAFSAAATPAGLAVAIVGTAITTNIDSSGRFVLSGVPAGRVELRFSGNGVDARLVIEGVGDRDEVRITVRISGSSVQVEDRRHGRPDNRVEIEGRLTNVNTTMRILGVAGTVVRVPTDVVIRRGGTAIDFAALRAGDRVEIHAILEGSTLIATEVRVTSENSGPGNPGNPRDDDDEDDGDVEVKGIVQNRSGSCPTISFTINRTTIVTNAATVFDDDPCVRIANGDNLEVHGTRQPNGSVLARRIEDEDDDDEDEDDDDDDDDRNEAEVEGTLSGRSGSCPAISFSVSGTAVVTNAATEFKDVSCSNLANGSRVRARGTRQAGGAILARRVERRN